MRGIYYGGCDFSLDTHIHFFFFCFIFYCFPNDKRLSLIKSTYTCLLNVFFFFFCPSFMFHFQAALSKENKVTVWAIIIPQ